jgi:hypothetical protein
VPERVQDRQIEPLACAKQMFDERSRIEFAVDRKIGRDTLSLAEERKRGEMPADGEAVQAVVTGRE